MNKNGSKSNSNINKIVLTNDTLTSRGGMALFVEYLNSVEIYPLLSSFSGGVRKNKKCIQVWITH